MIFYKVIVSIILYNANVSKNVGYDKMIPVISANYLFSLILIFQEIDTFSTRYSLNLLSKSLTQT